MKEYTITDRKLAIETALGLDQQELRDNKNLKSRFRKLTEKQTQLAAYPNEWFARSPLELRILFNASTAFFESPAGIELLNKCIKRADIDTEGSDPRYFDSDKLEALEQYWTLLRDQRPALDNDEQLERLERLLTTPAVLLHPASDDNTPVPALFASLQKFMLTWILLPDDNWLVANVLLQKLCKADAPLTGIDDDDDVLPPAAFAELIVLQLPLNSHKHQYTLDGQQNTVSKTQLNNYLSGCTQHFLTAVAHFVNRAYFHHLMCNNKKTATTALSLQLHSENFTLKEWFQLVAQYKNDPTLIKAIENDADFKKCIMEISLDDATLALRIIDGLPASTQNSGNNSMAQDDDDDAEDKVDGNANHSGSVTDLYHRCVAIVEQKLLPAGPISLDNTTQKRINNFINSTKRAEGNYLDKNRQKAFQGVIQIILATPTTKRQAVMTSILLKPEIAAELECHIDEFKKLVACDVETVSAIFQLRHPAQFLRYFVSLGSEPTEQTTPAMVIEAFLVMNNLNQAAKGTPLPAGTFPRKLDCQLGDLDNFIKVMQAQVVDQAGHKAKVLVDTVIDVSSRRSANDISQTLQSLFTVSTLIRIGIISTGNTTVAFAMQKLVRGFDMVCIMPGIESAGKCLQQANLRTQLVTIFSNLSLPGFNKMTLNIRFMHVSQGWGQNHELIAMSNMQDLLVSYFISSKEAVQPGKLVFPLSDTTVKYPVIKRGKIGLEVDDLGITLCETDSGGHLKTLGELYKAASTCLQAADDTFAARQVAFKSSAAVSGKNPAVTVIPVVVEHDALLAKVESFLRDDPVLDAVIDEFVRSYPQGKPMPALIAKVIDDKFIPFACAAERLEASSLSVHLSQWLYDSDSSDDDDNSSDERKQSLKSACTEGEIDTLIATILNEKITTYRNKYQATPPGSASSAASFGSQFSAAYGSPYTQGAYSMIGGTPVRGGSGSTSSSQVSTPGTGTPYVVARARAQQQGSAIPLFSPLPQPSFYTPAKDGGAKISAQENAAEAPQSIHSQDMTRQSRQALFGRAIQAEHVNNDERGNSHTDKPRSNNSLKAQSH